MPRPRVPLLKAKITGRVSRNPNRFKNRTQPKSHGPIGDPPAWLKKKSEQEAWHTLSADLPWLNRSDRTLVALACGIMGRLIDGEEVGTKALSLLRMCLNSMGASPADASKVQIPLDEEPHDPAKKYFT